MWQPRNLLTFLILSELLSSPALAGRGEWYGTWTGSGTLASEAPAEGQPASKSDCGPMNLVIHHDRQARWEGFWVISGLPSCGLPSALAVSFQLEVRDGVLFSAGEPLGSISNERIRILKYSPTFKEFIEIERIPADGSIVYRKVLTPVSTLRDYFIEATLAPKPSTPRTPQ